MITRKTSRADDTVFYSWNKLTPADRVGNAHGIFTNASNAHGRGATERQKLKDLGPLTTASLGNGVLAWRPKVTDDRTSAESWTVQTGGWDGQLRGEMPSNPRSREWAPAGGVSLGRNQSSSHFRHAGPGRASGDSAHARASASRPPSSLTRESSRASRASRGVAEVRPVTAESSPASASIGSETRPSGERQPMAWSRTAVGLSARRWPSA